MNESDAGKNNDEGVYRSILWKTVGNVYKMYFKPAKMKTGTRFFWAWLGSLTLYMPLFVFEPDFRTALEKKTLGQIWTVIACFDLLKIVTIMLCLASSIAIGAMLAMSSKRYGSVRLYLSGLLLSSFVVVIVVSGYNLWPRSASGATGAAFPGEVNGTTPARAPVALVGVLQVGTDGEPPGRCAEERSGSRESRTDE